MEVEGLTGMCGVVDWSTAARRVIDLIGAYVEGDTADVTELEVQIAQLAECHILLANGGLSGYLSNVDGETMAGHLEGLALLGDTVIARGIRAVAAKGPPDWSTLQGEKYEAWERRNGRLIDLWDDRMTDEVSELHRRIHRYVGEHWHELPARNSIQPGGVGSSPCGDERVRLAVLDGPVMRRHPCFWGARLEILPGGSGTGPFDSHATNVASILFAQPGKWMTGISHRCTGLLIPVFGVDPGTFGELARGVHTAVDAGAHVVLIPAGQLRGLMSDASSLDDAIAYATSRRTLIVAAAGNDGLEVPTVPACHPEVLAVGGMTRARKPWNRSNYGASFLPKAVMAIADRVTGADLDGGYASFEGTSAAAAIVAGVAAVVCAETLRIAGTFDPLGVRDLLVETVGWCKPAAPGEPNRVLNGAVSLNGALREVYCRAGLTEESPNSRHPTP